MPSFGQNLENDKAKAVAGVNAAIASVRRTFATDIAFQQEAYYKKRAEAEGYLALNPPPATLNDFPLLKEITVIRSMTAVDLANLWITTNDTWGPILNATEVVRERALVAIAAAASRADIAAALAQFDTDLAALS